ncbi:MAG: hypothetical protein K2W78_10295 [Xanthobacteraceae bacterium]|nr:hypothetical protein [Xanthobacteraceae bacterium]
MFKSLRLVGFALTISAAAMSMSAAQAGDADVVSVQTTNVGPDTYSFAVTVKSKDTGWDRYADRLEAVGPDGAVLGTRPLVHPHDDEQPFTRDLSDVKIKGPLKVTIRAHFKPTGFDGETKTVSVP